METDFVVIDCFTKWIEPLKSIKAKTVGEIFVKQIIVRHGILLEIHTDQGKNLGFESKIFLELTCLLDINTRTTPFFWNG